MRRLTALAIVALSGIVLTACSPSTVTPSAVKPSAVKPLLVGLIDKGSEASYHLGQPYPVVDLSGVAAQSGVFGGVVVNQTWEQLEPTQGTFNFSTLDASLAAVTAYNSKHANAPIGVRLRVFAAFVAPAWAKSLDGTPIAVPAHLRTDPGGGHSASGGSQGIGPPGRRYRKRWQLDTTPTRSCVRSPCRHAPR